MTIDNCQEKLVL